MRSSALNGLSSLCAVTFAFNTASSVIHAQAQRFWATTLSNVVHMDEVIAEHDEIIEALESGDKQRAADAARAHIFSFKRALLST